MAIHTKVAPRRLKCTISMARASYYRKDETQKQVHACMILINRHIQVELYIWDQYNKFAIRLNATLSQGMI